IDQDLVRALAHPTRVMILEALQGRTASPTELARRFGESLGVISYHATALLEVECLEQVRTRPKRGTIEHFYTARPRSFIGHQDWRRAPRSVRGGVTDAALRTFVEKVGEAIDADTIDSREDTTLNWMPMTVDERGWQEVAEILDRALRELMEAAAAARARLGEADGIPIVTGLAAFEAAPPDTDTDPSAPGDPPLEQE
ncbi:MAG: helix-turn-helix transcriptional regulator, partial [Actinobacteria bacterium]|nr:helix-turn-helix transcriptional regulator [Actinomycetota bacterium]